MHKRGRIRPGEGAGFNVDGKRENLCDRAELRTKTPPFCPWLQESSSLSVLPKDPTSEG